MINIEKLSEKELQNIEGGLIKMSTAGMLFFGGVVTFIIGAINGYLRPIACSSDK